MVIHTMIDTYSDVLLLIDEASSIYSILQQPFKTDISLVESFGEITYRLTIELV